MHFNPRPPCGGRLNPDGTIAYAKIFQSTPSVWRATKVDGKPSLLLIFQSTPSVWRATFVRDYEAFGFAISIHALRVEGDKACANCLKRSAISIHALRVEGDAMIA